MLIDSHCHLNLLDLSAYDGSLKQVLLDAKARLVNYFLCVGVTLDDSSELLALARAYPEIFISVGLHPNEKPGQAVDRAQLWEYAAHKEVIAIGETGLDYYRQEGTPRWQHERFATHIACAREFNKPVIIHTRQAQQDTLALMRSEKIQDCQAILHCFTEDWAMANAALDMGSYISFSGIVSFKNAVQVHEVVKKMPLDRILIETDAPWLAPMPYRGKQNVPAYVYEVAACIASLRAESFETIAKATTDNFCRLFQLVGL